VEPVMRPNTSTIPHDITWQPLAVFVIKAERASDRTFPLHAKAARCWTTFLSLIAAQNEFKPNHKCF